MNWDRLLRLQEIIKEKIAMILIKEIKDPRLGFLTIVGTKLSKDKLSCDVLYSVLGSEADRRTAQRALEDATGAIQTLLGRTLETRTIPHLRFVFDDSVEKSVRMSQLISDARKEDLEAAKKRGDEVLETEEVQDEPRSRPEDELE